MKIAACIALFTATLHAQQPPTPSAESNQPAAEHARSEPATAQPNPTVPGLLSRWTDGLNLGISFTGLHDSQTGYATLITPAIGYTFTSHLSSDLSIPIYTYRLAPTLNPNPRPDQFLTPQYFEPADMTIGLHGQWTNKIFDYLGTFAFTIPTGDEPYGLSTGHMTFDYNNHFEHTFGVFSPDIEIGMGDSSALVNRIVSKDYTSLGPLAHFQAGGAFTLPHGATFAADAYEQLPIGDQKIYQTIRRGRSTITVVTGTNVSEDNGFITSLDIPIIRHLTFSSYYTRSLRLKTDVVGTTLTYTLRAPKESPPENIEPAVGALFR